MVIFAVYFASGTVVYMDANARVDIFYRMFSKKMQCILSCVFYLLTAVFLVVMGYYGYIYVARNMTIWCASVRIPWAVPFSALLIGAGNMLLQIPVKMSHLFYKFSSESGRRPCHDCNFHNNTASLMIAPPVVPF